MAALGITATEDETAELFALIDKDGGGDIDLAELKLAFMSMQACPVTSFDMWRCDHVRWHS